MLSFPNRRTHQVSSLYPVHPFVVVRRTLVILSSQARLHAEGQLSDGISLHLFPYTVIEVHLP